MQSPQSPRKEAPNAWTSDLGRRRSKRVLLSVAITVSGKTQEGVEFKEEARTLVVNAHGALISLTSQVAMNQLVTVSNKSTQQSRECRVIYAGNAQADKAEKAQMGIEFLTPSPSFWQIDFPPEDWVVPES